MSVSRPGLIRRPHDDAKPGSYFLPGLPDWRWLAELLRPFVLRPVERIWKEDLDAGVCIDGWPGLPASARAQVPKVRQEVTYPPLPAGFALASLRPLEIKSCSIDGRSTIHIQPASGAHRIDGVGKPLALALHALRAGNLTFAGGIERSVANLDLTLSLVMADDQAVWRDAGTGQLERMRRRAVEQLFAAAKHDRHREDAHNVDEVVGEQRVDEFGTALGDEVRAVFLLQALHVGATRSTAT